MFEAEIKYLATTPLPCFGQPSGEVLSRDCYFDSPDGTFYASGQELRLRRMADRTLITYKRPPFEAVSRSKEEWETGLADPQAMRDILTGLGYVVRLEFAKHRRLYGASHQGLSLSVAVATVDFCAQTFVEIEHLAATREAAIEALDTIRHFAAGHGLTRECPTCYTDLYLAAQGGGEKAL
jgi:adenylate cyclase class 2